MKKKKAKAKWHSHVLWRCMFYAPLSHFLLCIYHSFSVDFEVQFVSLFLLDKYTLQQN